LKTPARRFVHFGHNSPMLWTVAAAGLLFGLGAKEVRTFEAVAARDIAATLEGADKSVTVKTQMNGFLAGPLGDMKRVTIRASRFSTPGLPLFCEPERSAKGRVRNLRIELRDFVLGGLRVDHLEADIPDCRYDYSLALRKKQIRLSRSGTGQGRVRVLEKDLEAYLLSKFRELKSVSLRLDRNRVYVKGHGEFIVVKTDFEVIAKLVPMDGTKLVLAEAKVFFGEFIADEAVRDLVLNTLNPVVDLDQDLHLFGAVQIERVSLENGVLEALGATRIPNRPNQTPSKAEGTLSSR
jgi:hypothetical protein